VLRRGFSVWWVFLGGRSNRNSAGGSTGRAGREPRGRGTLVSGPSRPGVGLNAARLARDAPVRCRCRDLLVIETRFFCSPTTSIRQPLRISSPDDFGEAAVRRAAMPDARLDTEAVPRVVCPWAGSSMIIIRRLIPSSCAIARGRTTSPTRSPFFDFRAARSRYLTSAVRRIWASGRLPRSPRAP